MESISFFIDSMRLTSFAFFPDDQALKTLQTLKQREEA